MTTGRRLYAADEIQAPELIALKTVYDEARGAGTSAERAMAAFADLPAAETLPGLPDLAIVECLADRSYRYLAMGNGYARIAALKPGADGVVRETRPVVRQHFDLAINQREPFHVSITRWDGPKILQFDRLVLPLDDGTGGADGGIVTHLLTGDVFLRFARGG